MILDDSKFDRRRIRRISRQTGLPTILDEVTTITGLCDSLDEGRFNLIFLACRLSEGDGLNALMLVRRHPTRRQCPVIMLANGDDPDVASRALHMGCSGYLSKSHLTAQGLRRAVVAANDAADRAAKAGRLSGARPLK